MKINIILPTFGRWEQFHKTTMEIAKETTAKYCDINIMAVFSKFEDIGYKNGEEIHDSNVYKMFSEKNPLKEGDYAIVPWWHGYNVILYCNPLGGCHAMHCGFIHSNADWLIYLNDDIEFYTKDWLSKCISYISSNNGIKLFAFNDHAPGLDSPCECCGQIGIQRSRGRWAPFGIINREWYLQRYADGNPYKSFNWDNEIADRAKTEGVYKFLEDVKLIHHVDLKERDWKKFRLEKEIYISRKKKLGTKETVYET